MEKCSLIFVFNWKPGRAWGWWGTIVYIYRTWNLVPRNITIANCIANRCTIYRHEIVSTTCPFNVHFWKYSICVSLNFMTKIFTKNRLFSVYFVATTLAKDQSAQYGSQSLRFIHSLHRLSDERVCEIERRRREFQKFSPDHFVYRQSQPRNSLRSSTWRSSPFHWLWSTWPPCRWPRWIIACSILLVVFETDYV